MSMLESSDLPEGEFRTLTGVDGGATVGFLLSPSSPSLPSSSSGSLGKLPALRHGTAALNPPSFRLDHQSGTLAKPSFFSIVMSGITCLYRQPCCTKAQVPVWIQWEQYSFFA